MKLSEILNNKEKKLISNINWEINDNDDCLKICCIKDKDNNIFDYEEQINIFKEIIRKIELVHYQKRELGYE